MVWPVWSMRKELRLPPVGPGMTDLTTTPGTPPDRVAALRRAFHDTLKDPEFIADAKRQNAELRPMSGDQLAQLYRDLIGAPQDVKDRVKVALEPKLSDTQEIKVQGARPGAD